MNHGKLAAGLALTAALGCVAWAGSERSVPLQNLPKAGAFLVRNDGAAAVRLDPEVLLERRADGGWIAQPIGLRLDPGAVAAAGKCVALAAGAELRPPAWNGFSCAPQVPGPCRANIYMGPGTFRFVARDCGRKRRFTGEPFVLPAEAK